MRLTDSDAAGEPFWQPVTTVREVGQDARPCLARLADPTPRPRYSERLGTDSNSLAERGNDDSSGDLGGGLQRAAGPVEALLRRARGHPRGGRQRVGGSELDPLARQVSIDGAPVHLAKKEFALLCVLATEPTRVFTNVNFGTSRIARVSRDPRFRDEKSDPLPPSWTMSNSPPPGRRIMRPATGFSYFIRLDTGS